MEIKIQVIIIAITTILCLALGDLEITCILLGVCIVLLLVTSVVFYKKREKDIDVMITYLMKVQDRLELPELSAMQEGKIGILQSEIYKLVAILKEQYSGEHKQKKYLVDLLSDISHQIKTPMTAMTLMSDLMKTPDLTEEKRLDYISKIDSQIDRINWLIRNLLTLSQLEADMLPLKSEQINAEQLVKNATVSLETLADVRGVELNTEAKSEMLLACDKQWTTEALSNIIKNCIEHTPEGGNVDVEVTQNNLYTQIIIKDNGAGISKEHLPYIFKRFYKVDGASNSSVGIGLSMSKQIIMRQGGMIDVKSELGKGTEFTIKLYKK